MIKRLFFVMEDALCAIVLIVMTALTFVNVIARYLFKSSMPFVEELTAVGLVILSLVGAAVAIKRGSHLGLSALTDLFPRNFHKWIALLGELSGIGECSNDLFWIFNDKTAIHVETFLSWYAMAPVDVWCLGSDWWLNYDVTSHPACHFYNK